MEWKLVVMLFSTGEMGSLIFSSALSGNSLHIVDNSDIGVNLKANSG